MSSKLRVGVAGPVGSGKTALVETLCLRLKNNYEIAVVTNDIYTKEDAIFLINKKVLDEGRIIGVETGGCPHTAIREDCSLNKNAVLNLENKYKFERIIFQLQDNNKLGIVIHTKNIEFINSYINANDEEFFKQKIFANFNELFSNNYSVNQLTCNEGISIMKWRASQPSGMCRTIIFTI